MVQGDRIHVLRFSETQRRIPGPGGEHAVRLLQRGSLDIALSIPVSPTPQTPHAQDELYVIIGGRESSFTMAIGTQSRQGISYSWLQAPTISWRA